MDRIVQQNATNAQEINAQARNMKTFVGELVTIVDGSAYTRNPSRASKLTCDPRSDTPRDLPSEKSRATFRELQEAFKG